METSFHKIQALKIKYKETLFSQNIFQIYYCINISKKKKNIHKAFLLCIHQHTDNDANVISAKTDMSCVIFRCIHLLQFYVACYNYSIKMQNMY